MEKKLQKMYLTYYSLLIVQDLWAVHDQTLSIFYLKEFITVNINSDIMIKNEKLVVLNKSIVTVFLNTVLKMT